MKHALSDILIMAAVVLAFVAGVVWHTELMLAFAGGALVCALLGAVRRDFEEN